MKTPHPLLITYTLTPHQLQRIIEVSSLVEVHYAPTIEEAKKHYSSAEILFGDIPRDQFLLHAPAPLGSNFDGWIGPVSLPGIIIQ